jgi:hypothetical protein
MSEQLRTVTPTAPTPVAERPERRQTRRAGISLQIRVRSADFNDGNFEEVRLTQNASRKAIYFHTKLDRYYKGMRVRVTSPFDPSAGAANLEQIGEVVRVHRRADGYGVALALLSSVQSSSSHFAGPSAPQATATAHENLASTSSKGANERRSASRSSFVAPVEILEMRTGSRVQARTADLSRQGCYVDTLNPLPVGTAVRLQIQRSGKILDVLANVSSRHAGSGMGLVFGEIAAAQKATLESWLSDLGLPPRMIYANPFPPLNETQTQEPDYTVRLVEMLVRKGILSQSEATEVLDGYAAERRGARPLSDAI